MFIEVHLSPDDAKSSVFVLCVLSVVLTSLNSGFKGDGELLMYFPATSLKEQSWLYPLSYTSYRFNQKLL